MQQIVLERKHRETGIETEKNNRNQARSSFHLQ